jgi:type I restriction enzyme R subunit
MRNAECKINKPSLLIEACKLIDQMDISSQNQDVVQRQFEEFIIRHQYNADPIRFLRAVQSVFLDKRKLVAADLYEPPLTNFGSDAVDKWFNKKEVVEIVAFTNLLTI